MSVYEAAPELKEIGAGVALHPNAMRVLRMIGVEDAVRRIAGRFDYSVTRNGSTGRVISKVSRSQQAATFGLTGATVHRADLLDVIAAALPSGSVTLGARCTNVTSDDRVAVAHFEDGSEVEADVIVGADGIHSRVREALFGPDDPRFTGKVCYRSVVAKDAVKGERRSTENTQWLGPHGTIVLYPLRGVSNLSGVASGGCDLELFTNAELVDGHGCRDRGREAIGGVRHWLVHAGQLIAAEVNRQRRGGVEGSRSRGGLLRVEYAGQLRRRLAVGKVQARSIDWHGHKVERPVAPRHAPPVAVQHGVAEVEDSLAVGLDEPGDLRVARAVNGGHRRQRERAPRVRGPGFRRLEFQPRRGQFVQGLGEGEVLAIVAGGSGRAEDG